MEIIIYTSDPDNVDPRHIASLLGSEYLVLSVVVNDGERGWHIGED